MTPRTRRAGRKVVALADVTVAPITRRRYTTALKSFFQFTTAYGYQLPGDFEGLDWLCAQFVQYLYDEGFPQQFARDFGAGLQDALPHVRRHLPTTWRWVGAWSRLEPPRRAAPLPASVALALAEVCSRIGRDDAAGIIITAFHALLRTAEAVSLTRGQVAFDHRLAAAVLALPATKTSRRKAASEAVVCTDRIAVAFLARACLHLRAGDRILRTSPQGFRRLFDEAVSTLGLQRFGFQPYSLRRGGATHEMRSRGSMEHVLERGRWVSNSSARIYIQDGLAAAVAISLTERERYEISWLCATACRSVEGGLSAPR